jgi:hypothetical protein
MSIFTPVTLALIVAGVEKGLVGRTADELGADLNHAAADLVWNTRNERAQTPSAIARRCGAVASQCEELARLIGAPDMGGGVLYAAATFRTGLPGAEQVHAAAEALERLQEWALIAQKRYDMSARAKRGRPKGKALGVFIRAVEDLYFSAFQEPPARSTTGATNPQGAGQSYGPFIRFLSSVHRVVAASGSGVREMSANALTAAWRRETAFDTTWHKPAGGDPVKLSAALRMAKKEKMGR